MNTTFLEKLYLYLNKKEDAVNDSSLPKNYFLLLFSSMFLKLGDTLSNPKTVLTWVMTYVNAPIYLISLIVPIRESGSMLPQILLANYIQTKRKRKWIYILGAILQFVSIFLIGIVAMFFKETIAGWLIVMLLILFSLARSLCSISSKDILGKTIPKQSRGKLKGYTVSISGVLVLLAGLYLIYKSKSNAGIEFYSYILFFASSMWLITALFYYYLKEKPSTNVIDRKPLSSAFNKFKIVSNDLLFRKFIIARSLLLCSALTAPFYVLLAQKNIGDSSFLLGVFIIANGVASIISAPFWGKMADISSKNVMSFASIIAALLGLFIVFIITFFPEYSKLYWLYPISFFILGIAHEGVRLGRKTYIVDMAEGNKRTDYVSVSNTIIGFILLITGGISALASIFSIEAVLLVLSMFGFAGSYVSYTLKNVEI